MNLSHQKTQRMSKNFEEYMLGVLGLTKKNANFPGGETLTVDFLHRKPPPEYEISAKTLKRFLRYFTVVPHMFSNLFLNFF